MNVNNIVHRFLCLGVMALVLSSNAHISAEVNPKPFVVPELQAWSGGEGRFLPSTMRVVYKGGRAAERAARLFAADYEALTGRTVRVVSGKSGKGDIVLVQARDKALGSEGYRLNIGDATTVTAATERGLTWGTRTLLQLTEQSADGSLPCGVTTDIPQYALRGIVMDCGRKFIPMSYLRSLVKILAYYKMNTLHVHLNDNGFRQYFDNDWNKTQAAFRLECTTYPGLTAKDGAYTKQEFIDLQKLAETYGVEIIPEIDVPAHSLAFTHYKPEIASKDYGDDHLDLFNPETYKFLDGLFKEYVDGKNPVFRGKRVHIGTDEYSNAKKEVVEKFRYFTDHYIKYIERFGKEAVVWGALTHAKGETPVKSDGVLMYCWYNGYAQPRGMIKQGYKLVSIPDGLVYIVPAAGYYYDYLNCKHLYENWTPATIGREKFDEQNPAIEGGMFAVWNDHVGNGISTKDIHDRVMPALQTLAVKCWTGQNTHLPYTDFDRQRHTLSEAPGVNEAGRLKQEINVAEVRPGMRLDVEEVGYDYTVTFTVKGVAETKGTPLFTSANATFYLSDPRDGKLGFSRDGYLNTFNYRIPTDKTVEITIQGNNRMTRLLVDGRKVEELDPQTLYVVRPEDCPDYQYGPEGAWRPTVYAPKARMHYQRTLVFPLREAGLFKSTVTNLKVKNAL